MSLRCSSNPCTERVEKKRGTIGQENVNMILNSKLHQRDNYHSKTYTNFCEETNGGRAHYVVGSRIQCKPFWLATQLYPQNDWTGWKNRVNYDIWAQAPLGRYKVDSYLSFLSFACLH